MILGVDEAGRGPVLGPLAVAAVMVASQDELAALGVADSKTLTAKRRGELKAAIRRCSASAVELVPPATIDRYVADNALNRLEAVDFARLIARLRPREAWLDTVGEPDHFAAVVGGLLPAGLDVAIVARPRADAEIPVVGAASILAKEAREAAMVRLRAEIGECGSGYPSDTRTRRFLKRYRVAHGAWPPGTRRSWKTLGRLVPVATLDTFGATNER